MITFCHARNRRLPPRYDITYSMFLFTTFLSAMFLPARCSCSYYFVACDVYSAMFFPCDVSPAIFLPDTIPANASGCLGTGARDRGCWRRIHCDIMARSVRGNGDREKLECFRARNALNGRFVLQSDKQIWTYATPWECFERVSSVSLSLKSVRKRSKLNGKIGVLC